MTWQIEFGKKARKDFAALDRPIQRSVYNYLYLRIADANHPKDFGKPLRHSLSGFGVIVSAITESSVPSKMQIWSSW